MRSLLELTLMPFLFLPMLGIKVWEHYFMAERLIPKDYDYIILNNKNN